MISDEAAIDRRFVRDWSPFSCRVVSDRAQIIRRWVCDTSPTCLRITYFVTRIQREHIDAFYHFNCSMVRRAGKKTKETAPPAGSRLETTTVVRCTGLLRQSQRQRLHHLKTNDSILKCNILSMIDRQLVTDQSPFSWHQSPKIRRLITDRSQTVTNDYRRIYGETLPINPWKVAKPIADWSAIIYLFIIWRRCYSVDNVMS